MHVKVSVVVPLHNPGSCLDQCIESLLAQTLTAAEYEILCVDDGSDDGTAGRLATLAAQHAHLRVIHAAGTGGPGRPRNIGIEVASGEYVYFLDPDDRLTPSALERMYAQAVRSSADVLLGKISGSRAGHTRPAASRLVTAGMVAARMAPPMPVEPAAATTTFRESRDTADLLADDLFGFVSLHHLFRTGFLLRHRLRFADGPAWLDEERFVVAAYFHAKVISVLADEVTLPVRSGQRPRPLHRTALRRLDLPAVGTSGARPRRRVRTAR